LRESGGRAWEGALPSLAGVLIVEDEVTIAMVAEYTLQQAGFSVLGPAATVKAAMAILEHARPGAALLDVRLSGETSFPVADALAEIGVPFAFLTATIDLPERFSSIPVLRKPYDPSSLRAVVQSLVSGEASDRASQ
jgi:DNA-binding response OmpR family regulator